MLTPSMFAYVLHVQCPAHKQLATSLFEAETSFDLESVIALWDLHTVWALIKARA